MSEVKLPEGWVDTKFANISTYIQRGKSPKYIEFSDYPVVNQKSVRWWGIQEEHLKYIHPDQWSEWDKQRHLQEGDILWNSTGTGTIGRACYIDSIKIKKAKVADSHVTIIRTSDYIYSKYAFYWVMHPKTQNNVASIYNGSTNQVELSKALVEDTHFILAPYAEQKIIAGELDTLLAQVDCVKARLEKIPQILKRFRQAVLAAIVSRKLIADDNKSDAFTTIIKLGEIANDIRYGTSKKCSENEGSVPVLRIPNIGQGEILENNLKYADFDSKELSALALKTGDLLLIRSNGSLGLVGKVAVITENNVKYLFAGYLIRIRLNRQILEPKYISYCLQSPQLRQVIENIARSTSGVNNINSKELASLELPLPPLIEQTEIVHRTEQLFAYADTIEKQVNSALAHVNNLTQSILAKAFRGELTAQWREENPEMINGENSAAALLEKIKAERVASGSKKMSYYKKA